MNCTELRKRLADGTEPGAVGAEHLRSCDACSFYAKRMSGVRQYLRDHHVDHAPDAAFADRVVARLPRETGDMLGWAALRILPATLVLAVLLVLYSVFVAPDPAALLLDSPTEDLLSWVVQAPEVGS